MKIGYYKEEKPGKFKYWYLDSDANECVTWKSLISYDLVNKIHNRLCGNDSYLIRSKDAEGGVNYIYFIKHGKKIKIGKTTNCVKERLKQIQHMSPVKLKLEYTYKADGTEEKRLHKIFSQYREHGEWFTYSEEIKEYIKEHKLISQVQDREYKNVRLRNN